MEFYNTLSAARKAAREINGTYHKTCGGWLVMSWNEFHAWKKQK